MVGGAVVVVVTVAVVVTVNVGVAVVVVLVTLVVVVDGGMAVVPLVGFGKMWEQLTFQRKLLCE